MTPTDDTAQLRQRIDTLEERNAARVREVNSLHDDLRRANARADEAEREQARLTVYAKRMEGALTDAGCTVTGDPADHEAAVRSLAAKAAGMEEFAAEKMRLAWEAEGACAALREQVDLHRRSELDQVERFNNAVAQVCERFLAEVTALRDENTRLRTALELLRTWIETRPLHDKEKAWGLNYIREALAAQDASSPSGCREDSAPEPRCYCAELEEMERDEREGRRCAVPGHDTEDSGASVPEPNDEDELEDQTGVPDGYHVWDFYKGTGKSADWMWAADGSAMNREDEGVTREQAIAACHAHRACILASSWDRTPRDETVPPPGWLHDGDEAHPESCRRWEARTYSRGEAWAIYDVEHGQAGPDPSKAQAVALLEKADEYWGYDRGARQNLREALAILKGEQP